VAITHAVPERTTTGPYPDRHSGFDRLLVVDDQRPVMPSITTESPGDGDAIRAVHRDAFASDDEAELVDRLRAAESFDPARSLVAREGATVVGHALLSPVDGAGAWDALVLAPVAVAPPWQGEGVGSALVREALDRAREDGWDAEFLHGSPAFYSRFGFRPAGELGFENPFDTPPEEFLVAVFTERSSPGGAVTYPGAFEGL
jgi:putative acetyltransferase